MLALNETTVLTSQWNGATLDQIYSQLYDPQAAEKSTTETPEEVVEPEVNWEQSDSSYSGDSSDFSDFSDSSVEPEVVMPRIKEVDSEESDSSYSANSRDSSDFSDSSDSGLECFKCFTVASDHCNSAGLNGNACKGWYFSHFFRSLTVEHNPRTRFQVSN